MVTREQAETVASLIKQKFVDDDVSYFGTREHPTEGHYILIGMRNGEMEGIIDEDDIPGVTFDFESIRMRANGVLVVIRDYKE